jgi:PAS domain-containing protein
MPPEHANVPDAGGAWGEVFVKLSHRLHQDACRDRGGRGPTAIVCQEAMDAVPDGLVILNASHQIQWSNRTAGEHLGVQLPRDGGAIIEQLVRTPGFADYLDSPDGHSPFILQSPAVRSRVYAIRAVPAGGAQPSADQPRCDRCSPRRSDAQHLRRQCVARTADAPDRGQWFSGTLHRRWRDECRAAAALRAHHE